MINDFQIFNALHFKDEVNENPGDGRAALHWAAALGHLDMVKLLCENGADVNLMGSHGWAPLHSAIQGGQTEMVEYLIDHTDVNVELPRFDGFKPLLLAAIKGYSDIVKLLVERGNADIEAEDENHGGRALHYAAIFGHSEIVEYLLAHGAVVNGTPSKEGETPLSLASLNGHLDVVQTLVEAGAKVT